MLGQYLQNVRDKMPLIHNITNYVTVNDCANILLAFGASPIMADDKEEVEGITAICGGLNINIGTLNERTVKAMLLAGRKAAQVGHPIVLDPVGAGASLMRTNVAQWLIKELPISVIRGNVSEIKVLGGSNKVTRGVDANDEDKITDDNLSRYMDFARELADKLNTIIAISSDIDIIASKDKVFAVRNGHPLMSRITGSGCMLSAIIAASITAAKAFDGNTLEAVVAAFCTMGLAGEKAAGRMNELDGSASFRNYLIDAVFNMTAEELDSGAKYQLISETDD